MSYRSGASWLLGTFVVLAFLPQTAAAQGETGNVCVRDYRGGAVCTANDVRIEALTVVSVVEDCVSGTPGETEVVFETLISSAGSPNRYDIGLYLALDGGSARDGDNCYHDFLSGALTATPTYGDKNTDTIPDITDGPWWDGGGDGDLCGDIETNTQLFKTLPPLRFSCIDTNGDGSADVSVCTSWDNNTGSACNTVADAFPGTNSKCSCAGVELGIAPEPAITIVKSPASQAVLSGGTANFSFTVTSKTTISAVSVTDPDCDAAPSFTGGDTNNDTILTPDETWTYTCSKSGVTTGFTNTVTVTGTGPLGGVMDTDTADVTVSTATMSLVKTGTLNDGGDGVADAGDTISYTFDVTNTGSVTLTNVAVTDPLPGLSAITCPGGNPIPSIAVAGSVQCTASLTLSQAAVDSGQVDNTASANSDQVGPVMDSESVPLAAAPALTLVKAGTLNDGGDGVADAGDTISYTFQVTNTGNVTITAIGVSDSIVASITCPGGNPIPSLAPGASVNCTGSYTLLQADIDAGMRDNTADATGQDPGGNPVSGMDSDSTPLPAVPGLTLVKTGTFNDDVTSNGVAEVGETIGYTFDVTNTGNVTLTNISVTDPLVGTITCPGGNPIPSLAPGASVQCTGSYTLVQADIDAGQVVNTATADSDQTTPVNDMETTILPGSPGLSLVKTGTLNDGGDGVADAGDTISYTFDVTNTGSVTLNNVSVTDPLAGLSAITCPGGNPIPSLAVAAMVQCTASYTLTQADVNAGQVVNTATADSDETTPVNDMETVPLARVPAIGVAKRVTGVSDVGGGVFDIFLAFVVENLGNVDLTGVQVTDNLTATFPAPVTFLIQAGPAATGTLAANGAFNGAGDRNLLNAASSNLTVGATGNITLTVRITLNGASGPFSNTAVASASSPAGPVNDTSDDGTDPDPDGDGNPNEPGENDPTPISVTTAPIVSAVKTSSFNVATQDNDGSGDLTPGDDVTYTVVVTNTGTGDALNVFFDDIPDSNTTLVVGTVTTTQGTVVSGNAAGNTDVAVDIGTLVAGGGSVTITFEVTINDPFPAGVQQIINQGVATGSNFPPAFTDDPNPPGGSDPTVDIVTIVGVPTVPTLSEWGIILFSLLLALAAFKVIRR